MKEFTIEMDGKETLAKFKDPPYSFRAAWMSYAAQKSKEIKAAGGEKAMEDNPELGIASVRDLENKRNGFLIDLCTNGAIKTPSDFDKISNVSVRQMWDWLDECLGLKVKEADKNFSKA
jgi:hypothetical protein